MFIDNTTFSLWSALEYNLQLVKVNFLLFFVFAFFCDIFDIFEYLSYVWGQ